VIDVDDVLRLELERLVPVEAHPDWTAVVHGSGLKRQRARARLAGGSTLILVAAVVGLTTPLGAAIARNLDGFSAWLTGEPGTPASPSQQKAFNAANAHSWLAFPKGTQLRHLVTQRIGNTQIELLGFRSGSSELCLRVTVQGKSRTSNESCAALADLRLAGSPVRVVMIDQPIGQGTKTAWYGIDRLQSANLQITAGIADDSVRSVTLQDNQGRHQVSAVSNAFLYVAPQPDVGQRVTRISARTATGLVAVPFAPSPFGFGGGSVPTQPAPTVHVQRHLSGGTIGWLDRHESRGQPLSILPARARAGLLGYRSGKPGRTRIVFGRVLTPDPNLPLRVAVTLNAHHAGGPAAGLCIALVSRSGGGGGCAPYPGLFKASPISVGTMGDGPGEFVTADGVVSDDVAGLQTLLADGQQLNVPFVDNTFIVNLSRTKLPARLVAYDKSGKVIGFSYPLQDFAAGGGGSPARGHAIQLLAVTGPNGAHGELLVGASTTGGQCMYVRHFINTHSAGVMVGCQGPTWSGPPVQLSTESSPASFVAGRVRTDVATVRLRYADGSTTTLQPTRGYVLDAISEQHLHVPRELIAADGLARDGQVIGHESFQPLKH
jgi:hypothetical protein